MLLHNVTTLFQNHHEVEANPSQHRELKQARLKLLHSPSVPEEDSQATKKTSVIVTKEKSLHRCINWNASFFALLQLLYAWKLGQK